MPCFTGSGGPRGEVVAGSATLEPAYSGGATTGRTGIKPVTGSLAQPILPSSRAQPVHALALLRDAPGHEPAGRYLATALAPRAVTGCSSMTQGKAETDAPVAVAGSAPEADGGTAAPAAADPRAATQHTGDAAVVSSVRAGVLWIGYWT